MPTIVGGFKNVLLEVQLIFAGASKLKCKQVTLKSKHARPDSLIVRDDDGEVVELVRVKVWDQISKVKCVLRYNYFYYGNFIIARDGCAATFKVCYKIREPTTTPAPLTTAQPDCQKIKLLSRKSRPASRTLDSVVVSMKLLKDFHSKAKCRRGVNFGFDNAVVFASGGCRGIFEVCTSGAAPLTTAAPEVVCKDFKILRSTRRTVRDSNNQLATITGMKLLREFSKHDYCREGRNYYFRGSVFVVKGGCKGLFRVCYETAAPTPAPLTTGAPVVVCEQVTVRSTKTQRGRVQVTDANGNPVEIASVKLWDQISKIKCIQWVNFFFSGSTITTRGGCHATFKVCYQVMATTPAPLTTTAAPNPGCDFVRLVSRKGRRALVRFPDATISSMRLVRQFSSSKVDCIIRKTFGFRSNVAIARNGCKGLFQVCFNAAPLTTAAPETCKHYKVLKPSRITVRDSNSQLASISSVSLEREISKHVCQEGVNYFFRGARLIVRGGCKGVFRVCYTPLTTTAAPLTTTEAPIVCSRVDVRTRGSRPRTVDVTDSNGNSVVIVRVKVWDQISKIKCRRGVNFFVSTSSITVKHGCEASFHVCYRPAPVTTPAPLTTQSIEVCKQYRVLKPTRIVVRDSNSEPATINSVDLRREISKHVCREGVNYFSRGPAFIVRKGCKGVFKICYSERPTTPAPLTTTEAPVVCARVDVRSRGSRPRTVDVTDSNGNSVVIVRVKVWDQISKIKCRRGINFFVSTSSITVKHGCEASFHVCYRPAPVTTPAPLTTQSIEVCKQYRVLKPSRVVARDANSEPADINSVVLRREISKHVCQEGFNYFFRGPALFVKAGCKGVFRVCYSVRPTTPAPLTTAAPEPVCKRVTPRRSGRVDVTDDNGNAVEIVSVKVWDQISKVKCIQGINFFVSGSSIVVRKGCKASFRVCYLPVVTTPAPLTTAPPITCNNVVVLRHTRRVVVGSDGLPAEITSFNLLREISKHVCRRRVNFFFRGSIFVVNGGCKGRFRVCFQDNPAPPAPLTTAPPVVCKRHKILAPTKTNIEDDNGNPVTITSVRLVREISKHVCALNENYFFRDSRFVVRAGCKGIFEVCYSRVPTTPAPLTTAAPQPRCKQVTVKSRGNKPARADVFDSNGNPVHIVSVKVWDQISKKKCIRWVNYFFSEFFIIAKKGCQATFKVCYTPKTPPTTPAPLTTEAGPMCRKLTLEGYIKHEVHDSRGDPAVISSVSLVRDFSYGGCKPNTFRYRRSIIIVDKHCKGVFLVCYLPPPPTTTAAALTTTAEGETCRKYTIEEPTTRELLDEDKNPAEITRVVLVREVENGNCIRGVNFRFSGSTLIVRGKCKGVFLVCVQPGEPAPLTTLPAPSRECQKIVLDGSGRKPDIQVISNSHRRPIVIKDIRLMKEFSKHVCREWVNFFASGNTVVAKKGCKGRFKVCYEIL
ncbi:capsulin [Elysia marginata]|uniref:Capsulin n=1 Tax=Elysia marginata TaxID=1093978 RepID=A0AAV4H936_9GAST|nr:capsulin [Elysia marginata]